MNSRSTIRYPKLYNPEWMLQHRDLSGLALSTVVGCSKSRASSARRAMGICIMRRWTDAEREMVHFFSPIYPAKLVGQGLGRTNWGIWDQVHCERKRGRMPPARRRGRDYSKIQDSGQFWSHWQDYILDTWPEWIEDGKVDGAMQISWYPPLVDQKDGCEQCPEAWREFCQGPAGWLGCERVTIAQVLHEHNSDLSVLLPQSGIPRQRSGPRDLL